jgi:hypothetical protein
MYNVIAIIKNVVYKKDAMLFILLIKEQRFQCR